MNIIKNNHNPVAASKLVQNPQLTSLRHFLWNKFPQQGIATFLPLVSKHVPHSIGSSDSTACTAGSASRTSFSFSSASSRTRPLLASFFFCVCPFLHPAPVHAQPDWPFAFAVCFMLFTTLATLLELELEEEDDGYDDDDEEDEPAL